MCPLLPPPPPPARFFFSFFSVACQLRGQSCTFDDSGLPLPHYENVATIFFFRRKNKMWREPPPPPPAPTPPAVQAAQHCGISSPLNTLAPPVCMYSQLCLSRICWD